MAEKARDVVAKIRPGATEARRSLPIRYCEHDEWSLCDNTHPKPELAEPVLGYPTGGIPGYSHAFGGDAGSHAEYIRVPYADVNCFHGAGGNHRRAGCSSPTRCRRDTWAPTSARSNPATPSPSGVVAASG